MNLICCIKFGAWKLRRLNQAYANRQVSGPCGASTEFRFRVETNMVSIRDECGLLSGMGWLWSHSEGFLPTHSISPLLIRRGGGLYVWVCVMSVLIKVLNCIRFGRFIESIGMQIWSLSNTHNDCLIRTITRKNYSPKEGHQKLKMQPKEHP